MAVSGAEIKQRINAVALLVFPLITTPTANSWMFRMFSAQKIHAYFYV